MRVGSEGSITGFNTEAPRRTREESARTPQEARLVQEFKKLVSQRLPLNSSESQSSPPSTNNLAQQKKVTKGTDLEGPPLNTMKKVSLFSLRFAQIKEFVKVGIKKTGLLFQSIGKSSSKIDVHSNPISDETKDVFDGLKKDLDNFSTHVNGGEGRWVKEVLGEDGLAKLNEGTVLDKNNKPITTQRKNFLEHLQQVESNSYERKGKTPKPNTITMQELLGSEGLNQYINAIKEEKESPCFREGVFAQSMSTYPGKTWEGQVITYIGGPSASGKSFAATSAMEEISKQMEGTEGITSDKRGNEAVAIDGGIEREFSKIRSLVLQIALKKGFDGIEDLQKHTDDSKTGPKIKGKIKEVALEKKLNLVIPNTFVSNLAGDVEEMQKLHQKGVKQKFVEVAGDDPKTFKETVFRQGESRAWLPGGKTDLNLSITDVKVGCESKEYEGEVFDTGVALSKKAMESFQTITGENALRIKNDRIFVKMGENGQLEKSQPEDYTNLIPMTIRQFDAYNNALKPSFSSIEEAQKWLEKPIIKNLGKPIIETVKAPETRKIKNDLPLRESQNSSDLSLIKKNRINSMFGSIGLR